MLEHREQWPCRLTENKRSTIKENFTKDLFTMKNEKANDAHSRTERSKRTSKY